MSISEITRNSFQSGLPAAKWASLCKLFIAKDSTVQSQEAVESTISNSVLVLYRSYPDDPDLHEYLKYAVQNAMISVAIFVATFLQAARSPELHNAATLDMLCRIALDAHYSSGMTPIGSMVAFGESPIVVLGIVQDALALLRTAHSLPVSHFHQLTTSSSELVVALLSCVSDMSQVSTAQAMVHFADANDLIQNFRLSPNVRQVLETFALSLSLLIGDDAKVAREAQMMHTLQLAIGKGDIVGSSSNTDLVTLSLFFHFLISPKAGEFSVGNKAYPIALLVGMFRWTSWTPTVFYTQLLLCALVCLSQSSAVPPMIWKAFVVGRLPQMLVSFETYVIKEHATTDSDWRQAMQVAMTSLVRRTELLTLCDNILSRAEGNVEQPSLPHSISRCLLKELLAHGLLEQRVVVSIDPGLSNDTTPSLKVEAQDANLTLDSFLEWKLSPEADDPKALLERIWREPGVHSTFSEIVVKRFVSATSQLDIESMSHICKFLYSNNNALNILSLHIRLSDLVSQGLHFVDVYNCETVGDPQTALSHLGDVVLFLQSTLARFPFPTDSFNLEGKRYSSQCVTSTAEVYLLENLTVGEATAFTSWFKALFDSEGIEDTILRSTLPKTLLRIAATLVLRAIALTVEKKIDIEVLRNGMMYFTDSLLNWTLVGVIKVLLREIQQRKFDAPIHLEVLQSLLMSSSCPRPVLLLCGPRIITLLSNKAKKGNTGHAAFNSEGLQRVFVEVLGVREEARIKNMLSIGSQAPLQQQPRRAIQAALVMARTGKAPSIDVDYCLKVMSPSKFLQILWSELVVSASMGEIEGSRRLAIFILTMPRPLTTPPLLPIFLHNLLPSLIVTIDRQQPPEQTISAELLVALVSSVLTAALHLEFAMRSVLGRQVPVLGTHSSAMARRLATDLRSEKLSYTSSTLSQRLSSSQAFVTNFPVFMEAGM